MQVICDHSSDTIGVSTGTQTRDEIRRPQSSAIVATKHITRVFDQAPARGFIAQESRSALTQLRFVCHLNCASTLDERTRERCKIFHVRAENYGTSGRDRLNRILATVCGQRFAHEDHGANRLPVSQFSHGVENEAIRHCHPRRRDCIVGAERHLQIEGLKHALNFRCSFKMARRDDQKKVRKFCAQT